MAVLASRLEERSRPLVQAAGLDLVEVAVRGEGRGRVVRVVVDRKGGVDVASCQALAGPLGDAFDDLGELDDGYRLEVTSPGVDRPLSDRRSFDRVEGRLVRVHRRPGLAPAEVRGTVRGARDDGVVLEVDGAQTLVPYTDISKAVQCLPW